MTITEEVRLYDHAKDALDVALWVLNDMNLPDDADLGAAIAQTLLVTLGMSVSDAIRHGRSSVIHPIDERLAMLAIRDAVDRLLTYGATHQGDSNVTQIRPETA